MNFDNQMKSWTLAPQGASQPLPGLSSLVTSIKWNVIVIYFVQSFCVSSSFSAHLSLSEQYGPWGQLNLFGFCCCCCFFVVFFFTTSLVELELTCTSTVQGVRYCQTGPLDYDFRQFKLTWSWDHNDNSCHVGLHPLFPPVLGFVRKANPSFVKYCIALSHKNERKSAQVPMRNIALWYDCKGNYVLHISRVPGQHLLVKKRKGDKKAASFF